MSGKSKILYREKKTNIQIKVLNKFKHKKNLGGDKVKEQFIYMSFMIFKYMKN